MATIYYPAVFHESKDTNDYWIEFPDLHGCFSNGKNIHEYMENAKEALGLYLDQNDDIYERTISSHSDITNIMNQYLNEIVILIEYDAIQYARKYKTKAVKKTLTIPEWLNEEATAKGINFSQVLQEALLSKIYFIIISSYIPT